MFPRPSSDYRVRRHYRLHQPQDHLLEQIAGIETQGVSFEDGSNIVDSDHDNDNFGIPPLEDYGADSDSDDDSLPPYEDILEKEIVSAVERVDCPMQQIVESFLPANDGTIDDDIVDADSDRPLDIQEEGTLDLLLRCNQISAPLWFYDDLMCSLRSFMAKGFNPRKAPTRETFLGRLQKRFSCPMPSLVEVNENVSVPVFSLTEQLQDLLNSNHFDSLENLCANPSPQDRFNMYKATDDDELAEIMCGGWYLRTYQQYVTDPENEYVMPLILYADKTGTDAMQRYPLEPWMFTVANLRLPKREHADAWRHLGFVQPVDYDSPQDGVQIYHNCLSKIIEELIYLQENPPTLMVNLGGIRRLRKILLPVCMILGDQKSQDNVCGRRPTNTGGAGRVHRACMCSFLDCANPDHECVPLDADIIAYLSKASLSHPSKNEKFKEDMNKLLAHRLSQSTRGITSTAEKRHHLLVSFLTLRSRIAQLILERVFSMYSITNAFEKVWFGSNKNGVYSATLDDPMHFNESGYFQYMGDVCYASLTKSEQEDIETVVRGRTTVGVRSSVRADYPRTKTSKGFARLTLTTSAEKVGAMFSLVMALHTEQGIEVFDNAHSRLRKKYFTIPKVAEIQENPELGEATEEKLDEQSPSNSIKSRPRKKRKRKNSSFVPEPAAKQDKKNIRVVALSGGNIKDIPCRIESLFGTDQYTDHAFPRTERALLYIMDILALLGLDDVLTVQLDHLQVELLLINIYQSLVVELPTKFALPSDSDLAWARAQFFPSSKNPIGSERVKKQMLIMLKSKMVSFAQLKIGDFLPKNKNVDRYPCRSLGSKHNRKKPVSKGETTAILCGTLEFRDFLELSLCFHSWMRYSQSLPLDDRSCIDEVGYGIELLTKRFATYVYRGDGTVDSQTGKIHSQLRLIHCVDDYGCPMQWDAGKCERGLKIWAKKASRTARKDGIKTFTWQTCQRIGAQTLLLKAKSFASSQPGSHFHTPLEDNAVVSDAVDVSSATLNRKHPHFRLRRHGEMVTAVNRKGKLCSPSTATGIMDQTLVEALFILEEDLDEIEVWTEIRWEDGRRARAAPRYDHRGAWYDWTLVKFDSPKMGDVLLPAKALAFYKNSEGDEMMLCHPVGYHLLKSRSSRLISCYRQEFFQDGRPKLRSVPLTSVEECVLCFETRKYHTPVPSRIPRSTINDHFVKVVAPRNTWATKFVNWSREEYEAL